MSIERYILKREQHHKLETYKNHICFIKNALAGFQLSLDTLSNEIENNQIELSRQVNRDDLVDRLVDLIESNDIENEIIERLL